MPELFVIGPGSTQNDTFLLPVVHSKVSLSLPRVSCSTLTRMSPPLASALSVPTPARRPIASLASQVDPAEAHSSGGAGYPPDTPARNSQEALSPAPFRAPPDLSRPILCGRTGSPPTRRKETVATARSEPAIPPAYGERSLFVQ